MPLKPQSAASLVIGQPEFERVLRLEYRRCERTRNRFALVLVDISDVGPEARRTARIAATVGDGVRETDVTGWYRSGAVVGVILTALERTSRATLDSVVIGRIRVRLAQQLGFEAARRIPIACHVFPDKDQSASTDSERPLEFLRTQRRSHGKAAAAIKRFIDVSGSLAALVCLSPLFALIALGIKATSPGPVLFRQDRVGEGGRHFTFLKFRSMYIDCDHRIHQEFVTHLIRSGETGPGGDFKLRNDPRVTPFGQLLRQTSLDELPQFLNVLLGDMSLVGPRPPIPYELETYALWHLRRIRDGKPGITGIWQVHGRSRTTFDEMVRMDLQYLRNQSLWLDAWILLKTPAAVLGGTGAR